MHTRLNYRGSVCSVFFLFLLLLGPGSAVPWAAQDAPLKEVDGYGEAELTDDLTYAQAKAAALNRALVNALDNALGVELHSNTVVFNGTLISDLIKQSSRGVIVSRKIIEEGPDTTKDNRIIYKVRVKASVKPLNIERRGTFKVDASVTRADKPPGSSGSQVFQHDDEIQIRVKTSRDAFIHIFGVDQNLNISKLYPNEYVKNEIIAAGKELIFPSGQLREMGIRLKVKAPKVAQRATESVLVVATTERMSFIAGVSNDTMTVTDLMKEISDMEPSAWADKTFGYEVMK